MLPSNRQVSIFLIYAGCMQISSCGQPSVFKSNKVERLEKASSRRIDQLDASARPSPSAVFHGDYDLKLVEKKEDGSGRVICKALFKGVLYSDSSFLPEGEMTCLDGSKKALLEVLGKDSVTRVKNLPGYGRIVRREDSKDKKADYTPLLPVGLNVVQNPIDYAQYSFTEEGMVKVKDSDLIDQGTHKIEVLAVKDTYKAEENELYTSVVRYRLTHSGFDKIHKSLTGLYNYRDYAINAYPPALLEVTIGSRFSDFSPGFFGKLGDLLLGDMELQIRLVEAIKTSPQGEWGSLGLFAPEFELC